MSRRLLVFPAVCRPAPGGPDQRVPDGAKAVNRSSITSNVPAGPAAPGRRGRRVLPWSAPPAVPKRRECIVPVRPVRAPDSYPGETCKPVHRSRPVNFSLSEEQRLLKDSAERFVRETCSLDRRRALVSSELGYSEESWRQMAELGWLGVTVPETCGGIGGGAVEMMVLMEAFGAGLVVEPYFPSVVRRARRQSGGDGRLRSPETGHPSRPRRRRAQARVRLGGSPVRLRSLRCRDQGRTARRRLRDPRRQGRGARRRHRRQAHRLRTHERSLPRPGRHRAVPRRIALRVE